MAPTVRHFFSVTRQLPPEPSWSDVPDIIKREAGPPSTSELAGPRLSGVVADRPPEHVSGNAVKRHADSAGWWKAVQAHAWHGSMLAVRMAAAGRAPHILARPPRTGTTTGTTCAGHPAARASLWTGSWMRQETAAWRPASDHACAREHQERRSRRPQAGLATPAPHEGQHTKSQSPYCFASGYAGWAKRASRPFPPPFFSPPSGSFSDALSTHHRPTDHEGRMMRGITNGDDAILSSETLIGTNDGVGQWAQRERGHAPLWSRLILHFCALEAEEDGYGGHGDPDPVRYLEAAYERTKAALTGPNEWHGTTTASVALLHYTTDNGEHPVLYVTQLGDCKILVVRPLQEKRDDAVAEILFSSKEQYHYFDCPRQLGTNSPDTPRRNAVLDTVDIEESDIVLALSDGVTDNLWDEEIADYAVGALNTWKEEHPEWSQEHHAETDDLREAMKFVAQEMVLSARRIAEDPFAASPFMEKAVEEGLAIEGGKIDDISVVAAVCRRRKKG